MTAAAPRRKTESAAFTMIPNSVYDSDAWKSLKPCAKLLYMEIARRRGATNNGAIGMTSRQGMEGTGFAEDAVTAGLRQLRKVGLIVRTHCASQSLASSRRGDHSRWMLTAWSYKAVNGRTIAALGLYMAWDAAGGLEDFTDFELVDQPRVPDDAKEGFASKVEPPRPNLKEAAPKAANSKPRLKPADPKDDAIASTRKEKRAEGIFHEALNAAGDVVASTWTKRPGEKPDFGSDVHDADIPF